MSEKKTIAGLLQNEQQADSWFEKNVVGNAPLFVAFFSNVVVVVSDVRAYDVIYKLTESWWKALAASFACAIPFVMWEIAWQYNHTTEAWRKWSLGMAGLAFCTSLFLGVADFIPTADTNSVVGAWLLGGVVVATGIHTVLGFLYYYNDPDVARRRYKAQALATMLDQELNAKVAEGLLSSGNSLLESIAQLEGKYSPEDVAAVMRILRGEKQDKPSETRKAGKQNQPQQLQPARQFSADTANPTSGANSQQTPQNSQQPK